MRKEKMITRTIVSTEYTFMCVDVDKASVFNTSFEFSGVRNDEIALAKAQEIFDIDHNENHVSNFKAVSVISAKETEILYGVTESMFMEIAVKLPPRGTKGTEED